MIYSLNYLMDYPCLFSLFSSVCLLSEFYFESTSNWGVGKKRERAETGFFLKLVYLEERSYKRFGQKLEFNLLSFFSVLSDWTIGCWLDFFRNRRAIFLGEAGTENKADGGLLLYRESLICYDLCKVCALCCFGVVL